MNKDNFIILVKTHIGAYDIKLRIEDTMQLIVDKCEVGGYFSEQEKVLAVAGRSKNSFRILVHEYGHFRQWIDNYRGIKTFNTYVTGWNNWLNGERNMNPRRLHKSFLAVRNFELDCEKRAVEVIKEYNLPLDVKKYIQDANAYMYFHAFVKKHRVWPSGIIPDYLKAKMPTKFLSANEYNVMPDFFEEGILKDGFDD